MKPLYIVRREFEELFVLRQMAADIIYSTDINKARRYRRRNAEKLAARIGGVVVDVDSNNNSESSEGSNEDE